MALQGEVKTSILVYGEMFEYFQSLPNAAQRLAQLQQILNVIAPMNISLAIEERYAAIRRSLRQPQGPGVIGDLDTLIAATAIEYHLTLVSADSDFQRVPGLTLILLQRSQLKGR
jgi:predicted nucleic acid-binding protein